MITQMSAAAIMPRSHQTDFIYPSRQQISWSEWSYDIALNTLQYMLATIFTADLLTGAKITTHNLNNHARTLITYG